MMGLDITAYKNLKKVENPKLDGCGEIDWDSQFRGGPSMEWSEKHFPGRGEGIEVNAVYSFEENYGFHAGSYFGYNRWRFMLKEFSKGASFQELINFADNEGVIGPVVSKKLYQDFKDNEKRAIEFSKSTLDGGWWLEKYRYWMKAFEMASNNGAVDFH